MNAEILNILKEASEKGVKIGLKDNSLTIKSATPIDSDLLQKIKENKALIIKYIEKRKAKNKKNKLTKVTPCDLNSITEIPLSFGQERLWFLDKLKGSLEYHMPVILRLKGALDISFLETSFCKIIDRHEVLRTNICSKDGIGYQEIMSCDNWILENKILDDNDSLEEAISSFIEIPFDLSKDYKLRVCLYNLGNDQYVLACVFHHIASDGWSEGILVNEFTELYSALQSGHSAILPELSLQYKDYAVWQRNYLEGKVLESQLSYWEEKLKGVNTLSLQTDYVRPSLQSTVGASIYFQLDKKLSVSIASLCKQEGVTTFMFLLSTFKILLSRYSGQNDICVGTPIANRTQSELEGMIGFFINTLALRSDLSGNPSFIELLKQVKDTTLGGYDNQLAPFEKVVNRVVVERDMNITPLFQVMFDLQSTPEESKETAEGLGGLEGITISEYEFDTVTSKFDLALHASENDAGIILDMEYCTALFDSSTIDRMLLHYQELLFSIVKDITQPIGDLSMLTSSEEIQLFESFNRTLVTYPKNKTIVDLFSDQASRTPNAIAVVFKGMELSYEELDKRSNQLGHYLREKGVKPDDLVGICLERSLEMLIGILGILKSGAAYVPIDPDYPKDRIDYTLDDAGINIVLSSAYGSRVLKNNKDLIILLLDGDCDVIGGFSENGLSNVSSPSDLAYVIYTSGSTGKPKGVLITHTNVVRLFYNDSCLFDFSSQDVWTLFHSFCFDFSVWEMYGALLHGGRLVVVPKEVTKNAISFKDLLINEGVTVLNQTPSSFYALQEEFLSGSSNHSLRYVIFGGEALNPSYLARWKEFYPDCRLINMYGITETTVHVTYKEITVVDTLSSKSTIGSAIPTLECYIVDDYLNLVPIGVVGELCIGGAGVARGYLNRGELTQEKFIDNPFSSDSKSRLYRSGDLGKWLADGGIEYLGRKDDQVKIRGYRIELGEIEHALSKLAGIQSSCVLAREDVNGNKRLIGYIVVEGEFDKESIQEELKLSLPDYMVPQLWVELDEMPLTSNGKLNKKSLPEPDSSDLSTQVYVAPRNETELQLVKIWKELLGVEQIGIYDNFFELGGDSIISIRLISKINETFDKHIQLRDLFNYSNIQGFSDSVLNVDTYDGTYDLLYKDVESKISVLCSSILNSREDSDLIEDIYPMSDVQQGMVMESLIDPSLAVFHDQMLFPFQDSSFDFEIFHKSILVLIEKHSIFRTQFNFSDYDQPVQIVHKVVSFDIKHTDLSILDKQTQEKRIEEFLMLERKISFQVQEGSLYRFHIFTIDAYNKVIVFQFHHAILDGWSVASFATELYKTYFKLKKENNYLPSKIDCSQRDFIIKEQMAKQDTTAISFWKEELSGYKNLEIFSEETEKTVNYVRQYDISFLHSIQEQCKVSNVTLKTVFFGAYIYALQMFTHEAELTVGLVSNNRPLVKDGDKVLGCFLNTLPVRYLFKSEGSWDSYFQDIEEKLKEVQLYGHLTFFEIKRLIGMNNDESLFDTLFNYIDFHVYNDINKQNFSINDSSDEDTDVTDVTDDLDISSFERTNSSLNLTVNLTGGTGVEFQYALHKDFKSEVSLERFHSYVDNILSYFCEKPKTSVRMDLILSENESDQLTGTFNSTELAYPEDKTIVELFVDQVKKTPESIAVVYEDNRLSYIELDLLSNQLAHYLLSNHDINRGDLIGVILDRSDWLIVSFLAILKTGGVYVPIDPNYPEARKEYIRTDSGSCFIIDDSFLDTFKKKSSEYSDNLPEVRIDSNDLAYVIYTSGSTGQPKGVMIEHRSIINTILSQISSFSITGKDSCLQFASSSFDASIWEICISLIGGAQLCIIKEESKSDIVLFRNFITNNAITFVTLPPVFLELLSVEDLEGVETLVTAGESISLGLAKRFSKAYNYINAYGPTEASICATTFQGDIDTVVPIGKPIYNTAVYIMNDSGELLPIGVVGELYIGGSGVGRGYLNKEDLTREKFISNPFKEGERLYKTGDLARWLPDGNLEFLGRKDAQVKIHGYRIELGEVENALSCFPSITQCCVLSKQGVNGVNRLVGYVVVEGDLDKEELQEHLKLSLPEYMVPMIWVEMEVMPLTSNGKLDRKSLPDPDSSELSTKIYVAPRTTTEVQLVEIWQDLLGLAQIGIKDDFFELGGHSLLATRLVSIIRKELGIDISIREVFEHSTISALGSHVSVQSEEVLLPTIVVQDRPLHIPLSFSQERLWFLDQLEGSLAYHIPMVIVLEGALDSLLLEQSLQSIVSRHEVLRTNIESKDGVGYQEVVGAQDWKLSKECILEEALESRLDMYLGKPFDLSSDYKLRSCLYDLGGNQYVLACVFHHIASDGWSSGLLVKEFTELYSAFQSGRVPVLPDLSLQYSDYAIWQRSYLEGEVLEAQLSYWEEKLLGVSTLSLATDYTRPSVQSISGSSVSLLLDKDLSSSLTSICQEEGVTMFMVMLSAFKVMLLRYSGQEDICVGTPIANRTQSELEGMIGFFVNTLALRSDLRGNPSFRELLKRVKETTLGGYDHQLAPFEKVVDRVVRTRDLSMTPLFQVMFDFHKEDANPVDQDRGSIEGITISGYDSSDTTAQFDVTLSVLEGDSNISLGIGYCTALFDKSTIEGMLEHYRELLRSIVRDVTQPIGSLSMLRIEEEVQLLEVFNATQVCYPLDKTVIDLFEDQVSRTPDAIAAIFEGEELSYKALDIRSNQLAHYLRSEGVGSDDLVGICLERGLDMLIGILGILKSAGAYVPIKPDYPASRISHILEDSSCSLLLTDNLSKDILESLLDDLTLVVLDDPESLYYDFPEISLDISYSPESLSYVIYTSGSTGVPKGAMIEHVGLLNHLLLMIDELEMDKDSVVAFTAPFTFDISVWQLLSGLLCGGRIAMYSESMILDISNFQKGLLNYGVSHLQLVPSYVLSLLETGSRVGLEDLSYFLVTGEAATGSLLSRWFSMYPSVAVVNAYGPAEASDDISLHIMREAPKGGVVPIGKPVANMQIYVVDALGNLCPVGVVGELWTSGIGVGRGYLNREDLTREKFIDHPFVEGAGRLYKTGDLGRWLPGGILEFMGRLDDQVKIRGYRIELGEIENVLSCLENVVQCCVLAREDTKGNNRLVGYVVMSERDTLDKSELQKHLKSSLPEYMVPQLWVELEDLPLTPNGKIDKKALPEVDDTDLSTQQYVGPRTETEKQLVSIWQELLGVDQVGVYDDFFELGGHSLLATRLVSMIRRDLGIEVSIREVFEYTRVSDLCAHLQLKSERVLLPAIVSQDRPLRIPLSFSQERLWFLDQLEGTVAYHIPIVIRLEGVLDISILEQSFQHIVSRHEVLRSMLLSEEGVGYQYIIESKDWSLDKEEVDDKTDLESSLQDYLSAPFDLSKDYKLRACLYDLGKDQYVLACVFHHIASDDWSEGLLIHEFTELYSSMISGRVSVLPELSLQYPDYAIWQREYLEGEVLEGQLSYWEEKLEGISTLSLPTDYARPTVQSTVGASISYTLAPDLSTTIQALCQREGVTMFMFLLSAFKVLLSRYSGQEDICVGTSIANRTQSELEGMIGFFVNILALRSDLSGDPSFRDLLGRVKDTTLSGYDHQSAPFEKVVDRVVTTRDMSRSPLFQVLFVLHNTPEETTGGSGLQDIEISAYEFDSVTSKSDLTLNATEGDQGIVLDVEYCTALFSESTIDRILKHYQELLYSIVKDVTQPIGSLSMLTVEERSELLDVFNDTLFLYPKDKTIVDLFKDQVRETPEAIAMVFEDQSMSYKDLDARSNQLVHYLQSSGVVSGSRIGILFNRGFDMIISLLGILKSGCTYVPLDPSLPSNRLSHILEDSSVNFLLYKEDSLLSSLSVSEFIFFLNIEESYPYDSSESLCEREPNSVAYIMYTSGTTGLPKGVMIEDHSIVSLCKSCDYVSLNSDTVWLSTGSISFDATTLEFWGTLLNGGQLVLANTNTLLDISSLKQLIIEHKVTTLWMTASWFHQIVEQDISIFKPLCYLLVGGDVVLFNYTNKLKEFYPELHIINGYGPTENTTFSTTYNIDSFVDKSLSIGKPIKNSQAYILNSSLDLLPIGVVGELYVGGSGLARGYLNNEDLTREKFISNPFKEGERIYKTGDLARWLPDGNIDFIGRVDDQVKIRGYRIELGEIESVLSSIENVKQCCVIVKEETNSIKRLVGYVVVEGDLDKEEIQQYLKLSLPEYMVPTVWVEMEVMPLTNNGKLDKKALPEPDGSESSAKTYVAPESEIEVQLVEIWQDLLGLENIGIHDNFFELGGHSLLATRLVSKIRKELSIEIEIADVFEHTTVSTLGTYLSVQSEGVLLPTIVVQDRPLHIPLSFSQERLWFLDQFEGTLAYHIPIVIRLTGMLDPLLLEQSLQSIVSRHEVLRTNLQSKDGVGYQEVIGAEDWILTHESISEKVLEARLNSYLGKPFDLSSDYKLRSCLYDLGEDKYVLACVFHHIASDGWSEDILMNEFVELYSAFQSGRVPVLPDLSLQYSDYAIWQRTYLEGEVLEAQLSYWEEKLLGVSTLSLPTDYARPSVQSSAGASVSFELDQELSASLQSLYQSEGVTPFMFLLSAFKVMLSRYSGQEDICVGTPIANRTQSELEGMIGFFVNTLAFRSDLSGNPSFKELLKQVKETTLEGYNHQLAPFEKVVDRVVTTRDTSMTPLFQVMFDFHNEVENSGSQESAGIEGITISGYEYSDTTAQFDLMLSVSEGDTGISLGISYCTDLFDKSTIEGMLEHYRELLRSIVRDVTQPIGSLSMLRIEEEVQLLKVFNDTQVCYPLDKTVIDLFEDQVSRTPDAIAAIFEGEELSYKALDIRSNQLAHYLRSEGVGPDDLVGICLERGLDMLIGILGILKSGGAYVPIKPDFPLDRIAYLVQDTRCSILLTDTLNNFILESLLDDLTLVVLDDPESLYYNFPEISLDISYSPESLSYVIYTSGSTGVPKGAMIEHVGLLNHLLLMIDELEMDKDSVVAFTAPFTFDISVWQLLSGLLCGGRIAMYSESMILDISNFQKGLLNYGVSHLQLVPSYVLSLLETGSRVGLEDLSYFLVTGEAATGPLLSRWFSMYPSVAVVNAYGPAEASDDVSLHIMREAPKGGVVPIGKPVANMQIYVVDALGNLCPVGVVGELWTSGVGVGRGYLNREDLTREKFIDHPFVEGAGRLYKTGDLGRWLPGGILEFMGRLDDQVKIRGYRIELGEIENVLSSLENVVQCCVLAREDTKGNNRLVGYVVIEGFLDKDKIQNALKLVLPEYMVPMIWEKLETMPLTPNGKIDKKSLPEVSSAALSTQEYVQADTELELELVRIWQGLLGVERVGVHDNFFELGGHSLLATRLVSMIRRELNIEIEIADVFEHLTIYNLGTHLSTQSEGVLLPTIVAGDRPLRIPLSFSQERLWFLDQLQGTIAYHMPVAIRLEGALDTSILEQSFQHIVSRHEVLRTLILSESGYGYQEIIGSEGWSLDKEDISDKLTLESSLYNYLANPFDLSSDYKFRACLYDLGEDQYVLACVFHHIASDGWSEGILVNEFIEIYSALQSGRPNILPDLSLQYSDYAIWQREYLEGEVLERQLSYWEEKLKGVSTLSLPTNYERPSIQSTAGASISYVLDPDLSTSIQTLCQREGVTMFMFLLSAFKVLLSRYSGQDDICVGTPIANRTQSELEGMIGFFVNTLALRSDLSRDPSFRDLLAQVKETTLESYDHQQVPFEKVVDRVIASRDMSRSPIFQVMFALQNIPENSGEEREGIRDVVISAYEFDSITSQFDLVLNVSEDDLGISLEMMYCTALFNEEAMQRMLLHYQELLYSIVKDVTQPIGKLSILTQKEQLELTETFNSTELAYPEDKTLVELFVDQVKKTPESIAVVYEDNRLSYIELDLLSNQLAHYLLSNHDINRGDLIGVILDRSDWLIVSFLAILKTGGVYVPIDPNYPEARKEYIRTDNGSCFIIDDSFLDTFKKKSSEYSDNLPEVRIDSNDLAYVIYTSGSTGQPKGVMIEHRSIINTILSQISSFSITGKDSCLQFASSSFDASIWEICISLIGGAQLCIIKEESKSDIVLFRNFITNNAITFVTLPPVFLELLSVEDLEGVETLVTAGESISLGLAKRFSKAYNYINAYGPTEASICATTFQGDIDTVVPIGKPIYNTAVYIMNDSGELLPIGVVGELYIGGPGVGRGYLNKEDLTREKFISNPFKEGERLYKTGDLARWLPDGNLEFLGRKDAQVKIHGYRIELGEVENALSCFPSITQCCVLSKQGVNGVNRLVGYVVVEGDLDKEELQEHLKLSLPEYMVPMIWVEMEVMPLTSNGKLDRKSLPDPDSSELSTKIYVAPRTTTEVQLVEIWQDLLGLDQIGIKDDFFELGGHSLLVIKLVARINEVFNSEISIIKIFEYSTIYEFIENMYSENPFKESILVALQDKGSQKAIYLAPPGSGTVNCYLELAKQLGEDQPLYAFQSPGLYGKLPISESIEEMASTFITEMQKVDPHGPYRLGGYSFGGIVAYEMALQLRNKGFEVEELLMLDSSLLDANTRKLEDKDKDQVFRDLLYEEINKVFGKEFDWSALTLEGKSKKEQMDAVCKLAKESNFKINEAELRGRFEVNFNNENYTYFIKDEEKLEATIILFRAMYIPVELENEKEGEMGVADNNENEFDYGWNQYTNKDVIVHSIPSNHLTLLDKDNIEKIVENLKTEVIS